MNEPAQPGPDPGESRKARRRYDRIAPVYDLLNRFAEWFRYRRWRPLVWERAPGGRVLEVGVGTGANLPYHPDGSSVVAIDLSGRMLERAAEADLSTDGCSLELVQMDAQALGFWEGSFDGAVATFVFCSVPDEEQGLEETLRVIRPGGRMLLLEHVRSENPVLGRLMDWLNPLVVRTMGVNINRDTVDAVRRAGFHVREDRPLDPGGIFRLIEAVRPEPTEREDRDPNPTR